LTPLGQGGSAVLLEDSAGIIGGGGGRCAVKGKPMIEIINEAIERTARLAGSKPGEVVTEAIVKAQRPLYSNAGPTAPLSLAPAPRED
jgi:hypothetical protein